MFSDDSLDSSAGGRGKPHDVGVFSNSELVDEIPIICRARDEAGHSKGYWLVQR